TAINRPAVVLHPVAHVGKCFISPVVEGTASCRPNIQQQITTFTNRLNEQYQQLLCILPCMLIPIVSPRAGESLTSLPWYCCTLTLAPTLKLELFGRSKIPASPIIFQISTVV